VGGVYRDEGEAAFSTASSLREENAELRRRLLDTQHRVLAIESRTQTARRRNGFVVEAFLVGVGLVLAALIVFAIRAPRAATAQVPPSSSNAAGLSPFDRTAALAALRAVDLSICRPIETRGWNGHAFVVFNPDGSVQTAVTPGGGLPFRVQEAIPRIPSCMSRKLSEVRIAPFSGPPAQVEDYLKVPTPPTP